MRDTLDHLVAKTINRPDSNKFLYVLNQIDTTAREDNPEDVIASWQRALAQKGLTAGRFFRIYNPDAAVPIADDTLRARYEAKRDPDLQEIHSRMRQVGVDRAYRVVGVLEQTAKDIQDRFVPRLRQLLADWRREVLWLDGVVFGLLLGAVAAWTLWTGEWEGLRFRHAGWANLLSDELWRPVIIGVVVTIGGYGHFILRNVAANAVVAKLRKEPPDRLGTSHADGVEAAFGNSTRFWRSIFLTQPSGWGAGTRRRVADLLADANGYVQDLNDKFTDPSGTANDPTT